MRTPSFSRQFKRDIKLASKRHKEIERLKIVIASLVVGHSLPERYKDHALRGEFAEYRECHIEADWLLIYKITRSEIYFARTGTHADLFG